PRRRPLRGAARALRRRRGGHPQGDDRARPGLALDRARAARRLGGRARRGGARILGGGLRPPSDGRRALTARSPLPPPNNSIAAAKPPLGLARRYTPPPACRPGP